MASEKAFAGRLVDVVVRRYRDPDGGEYERQVVEHPGAVAIVAYDDTHVYLVSQPREAVGEDAVLELPAGTMDVEGEGELECAKRELSEEVGLAAADWELMHSAWTSPGWADETVAIFAATDLSPSGGEPDADERIETVRVPLAELARVVGEVRDAKTLIGLLLLERRLGRAQTSA